MAAAASERSPRSGGALTQQLLNCFIFIVIYDLFFSNICYKLRHGMNASNSDWRAVEQSNTNAVVQQHVGVMWVIASEHRRGHVGCDACGGVS